MRTIALIALGCLAPFAAMAQTPQTQVQILQAQVAADNATILSLAKQNGALRAANLAHTPMLAARPVAPMQAPASPFPPAACSPYLDAAQSEMLLLDKQIQRLNAEVPKPAPRMSATRTPPVDTVTPPGGPHSTSH